MPRHGDKFYEEVNPENAVSAMFARIEKEHGSKIQRIARQAMHEKKFYFTLILVDYSMLEVTLDPQGGYFMGKPALNCEIEVY
jgi:hypothetical protein